MQLGEKMKSISVRTAGAGAFDIVCNGVVLLSHSKQKPFMTVGSGDASYSMYHGNFRIREKIARRNPCYEMAVASESEDSVRLLCRSPGISVEATAEGNALTLTFTDFEPWINRVWIRFPATPDEHIVGGGEQFSRVDLKGSRLPLWTSEQGVGRGHDLITLFANIDSRSGGAWHTTYFPVPAFVTSTGRYLFADTDAYSTIDFRANCTILSTRQVPRSIVVGSEPSMADAVSALSRRLGRQPKLPDWVFEGMWLGVQGGRERVEEKLQSAQDAGVKVGALWAQDWEGKRETAFGRQLMWDWIYHDGMYPELPRYIDELKSRGIRYLGYINPFLATDGRLYEEASARGFCVKDAQGRDYLIEVTTFPAALVDLTNPEAFAWIKKIIVENMIGIGLSGWMADFGEYLPTDAVLHSGVAGELVHNIFPALWARANREAVEESGKLGEVVFFMRAGYTGSTRDSTAFWAGDQLANWSRNDGLPSIIPAAISLGSVGGGIWHTDMGGYTSVGWVRRSKELFLRWAEVAVFAPIMRSHEGNRPDTNWQFNSDSETAEHLARMTRLYTALTPYHQAVLREYHEEGLPPIRHPALMFPGDERLWRVRDQFMYGPDLFVSHYERLGGNRPRPEPDPYGEAEELLRGPGRGHRGHVPHRGGERGGGDGPVHQGRLRQSDLRAEHHQHHPGLPPSP